MLLMCLNENALFKAEVVAPYMSECSLLKAEVVAPYVHKFTHMIFSKFMFES